MLYIIALLVVILSYLIGSISSSIIISKHFDGRDIRDLGSGNAGATNMLRVHGKKAGIITLLCDALKGVIAVLIGLLADTLVASQMNVAFDWFEANILFNNLKYIAGVFVVLGHDFPIFFGFRGGKGVATSLGVMLMLDWKIGIVIAIFSILIMLISKYVSLGSITGGFLYPVAVLAFMLGKGDFNLVYFISALILGAIVILKHHTNIKRLLSGTESKFYGNKKSGV